MSKPTNSFGVTPHAARPSAKRERPPSRWFGGVAATVAAGTMVVLGFHLLSTPQPNSPDATPVDRPAPQSPAPSPAPMAAAPVPSAEEAAVETFPTVRGLPLPVPTGTRDPDTEASPQTLPEPALPLPPAPGVQTGMPPGVESKLIGPSPSTPVPDAPPEAIPVQPDVAVLATEPEQPVAKATAPDALSGALLRRAETLLASGDVAGARMLVGRAASGGDAQALFALAETYDPVRLADWRVRGVRPDAERARALYQQALDHGDARARERLDRLR